MDNKGHVIAPSGIELFISQLLALFKIIHRFYQNEWGFLCSLTKYENSYVVIDANVHLLLSFCTSISVRVQIGTCYVHVAMFCVLQQLSFAFSLLSFLSLSECLPRSHSSLLSRSLLSSTPGVLPSPIKLQGRRRCNFQRFSSICFAPHHCIVLFRTNFQS